MNISSYNAYNGVSRYPVPARAGASRAPDLEPDGRARQTADNLLPVQGRNQQRGASESNRYDRSQAAAVADRIRGKLAPDTELTTRAQRALSTYQSIALQEQREALTTTLGVDVFV